MLYFGSHMTTSGSSDRRIQAERDLLAALSEVRGRRDQVSSQYEERLRQIEELQKGLGDGTLEPKAAQERVRQILGDRAGIARPTRAGRTTIGMQAPGGAPAAAPAPAPMRMGPSITVAGATLSKAVHDIDARVGRLLAESGVEQGAAATIELSLLRQMRRGIARQQEEMPTDSVLLAAVIEQGDAAQAILHDLEEGGAGRIRRFVDYGRELLAQLKALGVAPSGGKEQLVRARQTIEQAGGSVTAQLLSETMTAVVGAVTRAQAEVERRMPLQQRTLLDQMCKTTAT